MRNCGKFDKQQLYAELICALTHDLSVCQKCAKCDRIVMIRKLAEVLGEPLPFLGGKK